MRKCVALVEEATATVLTLASNGEQALRLSEDLAIKAVNAYINGQLVYAVEKGVNIYPKD